MKNYIMAIVCVMFFMVIPSQIALTHVNATKVVMVVRRPMINMELFEKMVNTNSQLASLDYNIKLKDQLKDSILEAREEQINQFRQMLGYMESRNTYVIDNGYYIGAYQFGNAALKNIGLSHINREKFLKNPKIFPAELQDWAVIQLAMQNQRMMTEKSHLNLNKYIGRKFNGVKITKGGILAAAHLIGWYDCSKYLATYGAYNPADGNGTHAHDYMNKFQNCDIVAFDIENDLSYDLSRIWVSKNLPSYTEIEK